MSTHPVIAVTSFIGFVILVIPIMVRLVHLLPLLVLGCLIPIVGLLYIATHYKYPDIHSTKLTTPKRYLDPFNVTGNDNWKKECQLLIDNLDASVCNEIYPKNDKINFVLNSIVAFILRDFVQNWYKRITVDQTFIVDLKREFKFIINQLQIKLETVDLAQLIIQNIVPILDKHMVSFNKAMEITKTKVVKSKELEESDELVSNFPNLHKAINQESDTNIKDIKMYISSLVDKIIPQLLDETEQSSKIVRIIIKEILGTLVLGSVVVNFSDPDFFNQLIESQVTELMNDRGDVKKLRDFIKESVAIKNNSKDYHSNDDQFYLFNLTINMSGKQFDRYSKSFSNSKNEVYLTKCLYYMTWKVPRILQLGSTEDVKTLLKFQKRTDDLINIIQSRLSYLNSNNHHLSKSNISIYGSSAFSSSSSVNLSYQNTNNPVPALPMYTLQEVIHNPKTMDYFTKWMNQRQDRDILLNYYTFAESLRNPLEYIDMELESNKTQLSKMDKQPPRSSLQSLSGLTEESNNDDTLIAGVFPQDNFKPQKLEKTQTSPDITSGLILLDDDLYQADDICALYDRFFNLNVLHINPVIVKTVHDFTLSYKTKSVDKSTLLNRYIEARKAILKLQVFTYLRMKQSDFRAFRESDFWIRMCVNLLTLKSFNDTESNISSSLMGMENSTSGDPLSTYIDQEEDQYLDVNMTGKVSDKVVQAVETALTQIMKDKDDLGIFDEPSVNEIVDADVTMVNDNSNTDSLLFGSKRTSRLVSDDVAVDLFGTNRDKSIFGDDQQIDNSIFQEEEVKKVKEEDNDTDFEELDRSMDDISVSGPGVNMRKFISFTEHIDKLNDEVSKLNKQKDVIEALLKKAEIINNVPETKLLTRSKMSLEREITLKELKREQYVIQDEENSLFDKSKIAISTFITERDSHGNEFTSYVLKITKYNDKSMTGDCNEWIVKRRFSEFYELHSYLKTKYDFVNSLDFPKRKMVMTFRQDGVIERRLVSLSEYLQELIKNEDICDDGVFKTFLSNETFDIESIKQHIKHLKSNRFSVLNGRSDGGSSYYNENSTFIQPITDLILNLFQLNGDSNKWIKGKTIVMMFQQVFGSAIEKFIRSTIDSKLRNDESVLEILTKLKTSLWPGNQWRKKKLARTSHEKEKSKEHARILLQLFVTDTCAKIIGNESSMIASETIWNVVQNPTLNRHLMLTLLDEIFKVIFD